MERYAGQPRIKISAAVLDLHGLCLSRIGDGFFLLYKPNPLSKFRRQLKGYNPDVEAIDEHFLGALDLRWNDKHKAMEADSILTKKGYGPLMFLIGMQVAGDDGLIPIQTNQITPAAESVYKEFYEGKGRDLIETTQLEGGRHTDRPHLNQRMRIKKPLDLASAERRNKEAIGPDPYGQKETLLQEEGDVWLRRAMHEIYD